MLFSKQTPAAGGTAFSQFDAAWAYDGNGYIYNDTGTSLDVRIGASGSVQTLAAGGTLPIRLVYSMAELYVRRTDQSTTQVTVEATVGTGSAGGGGSEADVSTVMRTKGGTYYAADYGQISDTLAVSHLAIQAAIDAAYAAGGGTVVLPPGKTLTGATVYMRSGVRVTGTRPNVPSIGACWDLGFAVSGGTVLSYPGGIVFSQECVGYSLTDYLVGADLVALGFDDCATILRAGARSYNGLSGSVVRDIYGSNITDWAFDLGNFQHIRFDNVAVRAKGGLHLWVDLRSGDIGSVNLGPGNSTFIDFYCYQPQSGAIYDGILIDSPVGCDSLLAALTFIRPQVNRFNTGATASYNVRIAPSYGGFPSLSFIDCDWEGTAAAAMYIKGCVRGNVSIAGVTSGSSMPWSIIMEACSGMNVFSSHTDSSIKFNDNQSAGGCYCFGLFGTAGETNRRPVGMYYETTRAKHFWQFSIWDNACMNGSNYDLVFAGTLQLGGARVKRRVSSWGGDVQLTESYASDIVRLTGSGSSTAVPSATNCAGEETRYINVSGGSVTITGVTGGDITLANGSACDVQAVSGAWYLINKQGT